MRMVKAMIALALLLDGAMVLQHNRAQRSNAVEQTIALTADSGDAPVMAVAPQSR